MTDFAIAVVFYFMGKLPKLSMSQFPFLKKYGLFLHLFL